MRTFRLLACLSLLPLAAPIVAQLPTQVEGLAPLLMSEDRRVFDPTLFAHAFTDPDSIVRRYAALSAGRIGDHRAIAPLVTLLVDRDSVVVANAFFALGLLRDSAAVEPIITRIRSTDTLGGAALNEAAVALARIGGGDAAAFLAAVLNGTSGLPADRQAFLTPGALLDGWHLGRLAPTQAMLHFANDTSTDLRWRALYSLGRLRAPGAGQYLLNALRDQTPLLRETAANALTRRYTDTAGLATSPVKQQLVRALDDVQPGVRVTAIGSLATFDDSLTASRMVPLLTDADGNVRVAAAAALGEVKGSTAVRALDAAMDRKDATWALRRAILLALARADSGAFNRRVPAWLAASDFRDRIAAIDAIASTRPADPARFRAAMNDPDPRVQAAALGAWRSMRNDTSVREVARAHLQSPNDGVRAAAASALRSSAEPKEVDALILSWHLALRDPTSDARLAVFSTLHALVGRHPEVLGQLGDPSHREFLQRPDDPLLRAEAAKSWPELSQRWGDRAPISTGKTLDDYRNIVRTLVLADSDTHVQVDVDGRGTIDIQLLGHEAPLTVANFLRLVDRHYFDGDRWHRVVPDFVVQDGDPTGTGSGGPGWSIRDEINRERYDVPMVGMALSGPDTGGSQWFINLSPQPHLDGQYTIFGKVSGNYGPLMRVVQGDLIRSIHR